jgi:uncharacterized integral membrane protein
MTEVGDERNKRTLAFASAHRGALWRATILLLLLIVVLQNLEPTRVDVFFWSLPAVPKLVLIIVSAVLGAILYAAARSWFSRARR